MQCAAAQADFVATPGSILSSGLALLLRTRQQSTSLSVVPWGPSTPLQHPIFGPPDSDLIALPPGLQTATPSRCMTQALELEKAHDEAQLATLHEYIGHDPAAQPPTDTGGPPDAVGSPQSSGGSPQAGSATSEGTAMVQAHLAAMASMYDSGLHRHGLALLCTV